MTAPIITLIIDGKEVSGLASETVLQVARENGISIPTLCWLEGLSSVGSCTVNRTVRPCW